MRAARVERCPLPIRKHVGKFKSYKLRILHIQTDPGDPANAHAKDAVLCQRLSKRNFNLVLMGILEPALASLASSRASNRMGLCSALPWMVPPWRRVVRGARVVVFNQRIPCPLEFLKLDSHHFELS